MQVTTRSIDDINILWGTSISGIEDAGVSIRPSWGLSSGISCDVRPSATSLSESGSPVEGAHLEMLSELGRGGMGVVYRARQASLGRDVAVKMLSPALRGNQDALEKFVSEVAVTASLDHPNIMTVHDLGVDAMGRILFVMKEVRGRTWKSSMPSKSLQENIEILLKVCDAVAMAHSKRVIHRDIKPENIMTGEFGEVTLMDWGLATVVGESGGITCGDGQATPCGTPEYMAPEMVLCDARKIGFASDIYLLGATLFEIITGLRPHAAKSVMACLYKASINEIQSTDKSGELLGVARKAMSTDISARHPTVEAFQTALRECLQHLESVKIADLAVHDIDEAGKSSGDYGLYSQSVFGFQEALRMWLDNPTAKDGLPRAVMAYAQAAVAKGDYDLAVSLLDPAAESHATILRLCYRRLSLRRKARKAQRFIMYAVGLLLIVEAILAYMVNFGSMQFPPSLYSTQESLKKIEAKAVRLDTDTAASLRNLAMLAYEAKRSTSKVEQPQSADSKKAYKNNIALAKSLLDFGLSKEAAEVLDEIKDSPHKDWGYSRLRRMCSNLPPVETQKFLVDQTLSLSNAVNDTTLSVAVASAYKRSAVFAAASATEKPTLLGSTWTGVANEFGGIPDLFCSFIGLDGSSKFVQPVNSEKKTADTEKSSETEKPLLPLQTSRLCMLADGRPLEMLSFDMSTSAVAVSPTGKSVLVRQIVRPEGAAGMTSYTYTIMLLSIPGGKEIWRKAMATSINPAFSADGAKVAFSTADATLIVDSASGNLLAEWPCEKGMRAENLVFDPKTGELCANFIQSTPGKAIKPALMRYDPNTKKTRRQDVEIPNSNTSGSSTIQFASDGSMIIFFYNSMIAIYPPGASKFSCLISLLNYGYGKMVRIDSAAKWIALTGGTKISVYNAKTGDECLSWTMSDPILAVAFSADGKSLRALDNKGTLSVFPTD